MSYLNENKIFNGRDILYNKEKFDNGEINLCFITGLSGSGKSTLANSMEKEGVIEKYELDDLLANYNFSDDNLKEYGDLIYGYFKGQGSKFRMDKDPINGNEVDDWYTDKFESDMIKGFVKYAMQYAKSHKNKKIVIEGVELYWFFEPEELKDYAVYIKNTSSLVSQIRSAKRDSSDASGIKRIGSFLKNTLRLSRISAYNKTETIINKWVKYYQRLEENNSK